MISLSDQEFIEFKLECQQYKDKIIKLEKISETQETRIIELEKRNDKTDFQYEQIMRTLDKLINTTIPELTKEIQTIKNKPVERYNSVVSGIISAIIAAIVGFLAGKFLK